MLLFWTKVGTGFISHLYYLAVSSTPVSVMVFSDLNFLVFILKEEADDGPDSAKHTVFLVVYRNLGLGSFSFKVLSILGHYIGSMRVILDLL